jgi:hypothetical protein
MRNENNPSYGSGRQLKRNSKINLKTYENENPGPSWSSTNAIHVLDCSSKQPRKGARELKVNFSAKDIRLEISQRTEAAEKNNAILGDQCKD